MKDNLYMLSDRDMVEILDDMIREHTKIINGIPQDPMGKDVAVSMLGRITSWLIESDLAQNAWILTRLTSDLKKSPNELACKFVSDLSMSYPYHGTLLNPIAYHELVYAILLNQECLSPAMEIILSMYRARYPKIWKRVEEIIQIAKSDSDQKVDDIYQKLAELYLSKDVIDSTTGMCCAVMFSIVQTLKEDFIIPSYCMIVISMEDLSGDPKLSALEKVIQRLTTGSSNPYDCQKLPDGGLKSFTLAEATLGTQDIRSCWIIRKYLKKRKDALYSALGVTAETMQDIAEVSKTSIFCSKSLQGEFCENFHIPLAHLQDALAKVYDKKSTARQYFFSEKFIDAYYTIKLNLVLDALSEAELEEVTTRDITGVIGMDAIQDDAAFFKALPLVLAFCYLANRYRTDIYGNFDFNDTQADSRSVGQSYQKDLAACKEEIREKDAIIARYQAQEKKREIRKSNASEKPLLAEISSLKNIISKKDDEIEDLKEQLAEEKEFCAMLESSDEDAMPAKTVCDLSVLKGKRFAFVCNEIDATCPSLRKEFPDSVFIETETTQGKSKTVDLVVLFTKHISHSIYFKVKKMYHDVPIYAFNRRSVDELKMELAEYLSK